MKSLIMLLIALTHATLASAQDENIYYVHNDHNGAPLMMTDQNQHVVWKANYTPFGQATLEIEEVELPVRYKGQYYDKESGLHYNYYRSTYNPNTGRYLESDPIGLDGGLNTYAYVGGNPLSFIDRFGLAGTTAQERMLSPMDDMFGGGGRGGAAVAGTGLGIGLGKALSDLMKAESASEKPRTEEKPDNCPTGTLPLDEAKKKFGLRGEDHNKIKGQGGTGSGPKDWVGIAPNHDVITTNPDGSAENWGPFEDFLN